MRFSAHLVHEDSIFCLCPWWKVSAYLAGLTRFSTKQIPFLSLPLMDEFCFSGKKFWAPSSKQISFSVTELDDRSLLNNYFWVSSTKQIPHCFFPLMKGLIIWRDFLGFRAKQIPFSVSDFNGRFLLPFLGHLESSRFPFLS